LLPTPTVVACLRFSAAFITVCVFVCLFAIPHDISKSNATRITKLDTEMFEREFRKSICLGVKRSKVKVTRHKSIGDVGHGAFLSADF